MPRNALVPHVEFKLLSVLEDLQPSMLSLGLYKLYFDIWNHGFFMKESSVLYSLYTSVLQSTVIKIRNSLKGYVLYISNELTWKQIFCTLSNNPQPTGHFTGIPGRRSILGKRG